MERAYADFDAAVRLAPTVFVHLFNRAKANQHIMRREAAIADFKAAIDIPSRCSDDTASREDAKWRYGAVQAELQQQKQQATSPPTPAPLPKSDQSNDAPTQRRVALVIGNQTYQREKPLRNPANDARAIAAVLRKLGFASVIEANDLSREAMSAAIAKFGRDSATADWAIVFYSGHGLQADRTTYLVPVDAKLVQTSDLSRELVSLDTVLDSLSAAKVLRLVILDACRDNPFTERLRRVAQGPEVLVRGLARPSSPAGTLVAFAAREGQVAEDGAGEHSPYTQALLTHIEEPNIQVDHMMRKVRDTVMERTKDRDWRDPRLLGPQEPYTVGSLPNTPLCFRGACPGR